MAITSKFFDGPVTEADHAQAIYYIGRSKYGVVGTNHFRVTSGSGDRTVNVAAGTAWGAGVITTSTATESVTLPNPGGTTTRWHLIVLRRNWGGAGGTVTVTSVAGSATKMIPTRNTLPGSIDDQPLALVRVQGGQSSVQEIVDLRVWGDGYIADELATTYLNEPGASLRRGKDQWYATQAGILFKHTEEDSDWVNGSFSSGWGAPTSGSGNTYIRCRRVKVGSTYLVDVRIWVHRRGGTINGTSTGNIDTQTMGVIPAAYRPRYSSVALNPRGSGWNRTGNIGTDGTCNIDSIPPNMNIPTNYAMGWQATYLLD